MNQLWQPFVALALGLVFGAAPAAAQNVPCTGSLPSGSYTNVTVPTGASCMLGSAGVVVTGNVTVAPEATLTIFHAVVNGNVTVGSGANLSVGFGAMVSGNVLAQDANLIQFGEGAGFGASVELVGTIGLIDITGSLIAGTLTISGTTAPSLMVFEIGIGANAVLTGNTSPEDKLIGNTIAGNLTCASNSPPPTNGGHANTVGGQKVGQCAGL